MPLVVILFATWFLAILAGVAANQDALIEWYGNQQRALQVRGLAADIYQQIRETGTVPTDLNAFSAMPGYEHQRLVINTPWQGYAVSSLLTDGNWQYQRVAMFSQPAASAVASSQYLDSSHNACGTTAFDNVATWCGSKTSYWWRFDLKDEYARQINAEKTAQRRLLQKFASYYAMVANNKQVFPNPGGSSVRLTDLLAGYSKTATSCTGQYQWQGIPLDCSDLYSAWGTPRVYNYLNEDYIAILATAPFTNAAGAAVQISSQLDATTRVFN
ncbi:hypothetical protein ACFFU8_09225 [Chromobacterium piscinae]|uniref:hypothetical protein n=1 Tax=Chromobacterium piscinae TaxID=686831 RepID=UPI001E3A89FC|nr:hypothetical protein [Chromobacterium piscinae]MCD5327915.1 hypothetical protein [Chromobacterium piscinae]